MASNMSVEVTVESAIENQIQEIGLDGQELYTQSLSMTEKLSQLAHKIDFSAEGSEEKGKQISEGEKAEEEKKREELQKQIKDKSVFPIEPSDALI